MFRAILEGDAPYTAKEYAWSEIHRMASLADRYVAAAKSAPLFTARPIRWVDTGSAFYGTEAATAAGRYNVRASTKDGDKYEVRYYFTEYYDEGVFDEIFDSADEAKAYAERDWLARVTMFLDPVVV
jgi:hypothetical protein